MRRGNRRTKRASKGETKQPDADVGMDVGRLMPATKPRFLYVDTYHDGYAPLIKIYIITRWAAD